MASPRAGVLSPPSRTTANPSAPTRRRAHGTISESAGARARPALRCRKALHGRPAPHGFPESLLRAVPVAHRVAACAGLQTLPPPVLPPATAGAAPATLPVPG